MFEKHLESLFCDDIRYEQGGKRTFVGAYNTIMYVESFPVTIPKLCIFIRLLSPADDQFRALSLRILRDDEVLFEATDVEVAGGDPKELPERLVPKGNRLASAACEIVVAPLNIDSECMLRIRATDEKGKEYAAAGLVVTTHPGQSELD